MLDYDDLLLYWFHLMSDAASAARVGARFDHVLVDEYQDTNTLQAEILRATQARRPRRHRRRRRRAGDLQLPRRARRQHPRLPAPVRSARRGRDARAELPLDGADPRRGQRGHRAGAASATRRTCAATRARRRRGPCSPPSPTSWRRSSYVVERDPRAARGGRAAAPAGGAVPHRAPQRRAGGRARPPQHPVREVRRPALPRGGAREGRARRACAGPRTRATAWPASASRSCCRAWARASPTRWCATWPARASRCRAALASFDPPAAARARLARVRRAVRAPVRRGARRGPAHMGLVRRWYEPHLARLYDDARARLGRSRAARAAGGGGAVARALPLRPDARSARRRPAPRPARPTWTRTT